jgi:UDP-3-O-acyl-N-acetylglucosamine deacetylase
MPTSTYEELLQQLRAIRKRYHHCYFVCFDINFQSLILQTYTFKITINNKNFYKYISTAATIYIHRDAIILLLNIAV